MMQRVQAYRFRLEPTENQRNTMGQTAGIIRFIWNSALALQKSMLDRRAKIFSYVELCRQLTDARHGEGLEFLSLAHSKPQQQVLKDLGQAFSDFFKHKKGFPKFKKRGKSRDSFRFPSYQDNIFIKGRRIKLPALGWVRFRKSREVEGVIKNATVSRRGSHWFVSIQTEREVPEPIHPSKSMVGVDMGVAKFAALSTGEIIEPLDSFRRLEKKLAFLQRGLRNKKKFSENWKKQKAAIAHLHISIADARNDFLHKLTAHLSKSHATVCLEYLKVRNMSASAKGSKENPGKQVRQKSGLNKAILDQGWYEFRRQLTYKESWLGGEVVLVPPAYTSQTCSACEYVAAESRRSQELFVCVRCGAILDADVNAARNILRAGQALSACGEKLLGISGKQEPGSAARCSPEAADAAA
jgi:putative transposase